jgi:hypothetical protein
MVFYKPAKKEAVPVRGTACFRINLSCVNPGSYLPLPGLRL